MKGFEQGYLPSGKKNRRKKNANLKKLQRYAASLSNEQLQRMISDAGQSYLPKGTDSTANAIYQKSQSSPPFIQTKMEISQPQDASELQADKVAKGVIKGDTKLSKSAFQQPVSDINTKGDDMAMSTTPAFDQQLQTTKGQGQKLDAGVKTEIECHLGADLSGVNIHTNAPARQLSESINAKAFTHGQDVYFSQGTYNPASEQGKSLLAHELTHTVQQGKGIGRKIHQKLKSDIYEKAILEGHYIYTKNYGWVDMTHAFGTNKGKKTGASLLWRQIKDETGEKSISPGDNNGFHVIYRQDASVISSLPRIGITKEYFVKYGLTLKEKEEIALAIFQEVSLAFEDMQGFAVWSGSSFEPADLTSNILSFYNAIRPSLTQEKIMELLEPLSTEESLNVYKKYPGTFTDKKYKNKSFTPKFFPNEYSPKNPVVPKVFQEIKPAVKGKKFREWLPLLDARGGIPPITGPK